MSPAAIKKVFLLTLFIFLFLIPSFVLAQTKVTKDTYTDAMHNNRVFNNLLGHSLSCNIFGGSLLTSDDGQKQLECLKGGSLLSYSQLPDGGLLGGSVNMVAGLFTPSLSTTAYIAEVGKGFGVVDEAYAQEVIPGSGNLVIKPILVLWQYIRNFSYLVFTFIFVVIGVMIMLRQKLNAQTFISIQTALPSLIIGLILVTFSYYLAALMVDTAFYGMYLVAFIFNMIRGDSGIYNVISDPVSIAQSGSMWDLWWQTVLNTAGLNGIILPLASLFSKPLEYYPGPDKALANLFGFGVARQVLFTVTGGGVGFIITLIIGIAIIIQMLRLFWSLLQSYLAIMIQTVLGPIIITFGSFPGKGGIISNWWKTILGHALVFPAVFATFLFGGFFLQQAAKDSSTAYTTSLPLITGIPQSLLPAIIGFGIIIGSPSVPGMVRKFVGVKDFGEIMGAATEGLGVGAAGGTVLANIGSRAGVNWYYEWARTKNTGTFHRRMAERMGSNQWLKKRYGLS